MKLVHQDFSRPIFEEKDDFVELIIESPECFGAYISELAEQCKGQEGRYVLSDKEKEVDLAKNVEIIFDIFSLEINEKRILNKLYSEMNELAKSEEFFVKTQEVIQGIQKYLLDLEYATDYILTFEQEIELMQLCMYQFENDVKMYGIQTIGANLTPVNMFENDVKMYGIQTVTISVFGLMSLRMM